MQPFCSACKKTFASPELYDNHLPGHSHRAALDKMGVNRLGGYEQHFKRIQELCEPVQLRQTDI
jgi:hypothetical protein